MNLPEASATLHDVHTDAFANGQIESKLWLRGHLFKAMDARQIQGPANLWLLAGWYAVTAFLLLSEAEPRFGQVRSFDIDPNATRFANLLNNTWEIKEWKFRAFTADCNILNYSAQPCCHGPDIVINTACEHFASDRWWNLIPSGTLVALQTSDLLHADDPTSGTAAVTLSDLTARFRMQRIHFQGQMEFTYPTSSFRRAMLIGEKA